MMGCKTMQISHLGAMPPYPLQVRACFNPVQVGGRNLASELNSIDGAREKCLGSSDAEFDIEFDYLCKTPAITALFQVKGLK